MGIDLHALGLLCREANSAPLGDVLTIGRQSMSVSPEEAAARCGCVIPQSRYCELMLLALGANSVESVDYSDYEGATHVADLGKPVSLETQYDTIIDAGSLEHVFDVACAFQNIVGFSKVGGRIIHLLPVNNLSGHGFWQFSSDLMYTIYSEGNGFSGTEVFYASSLNPAVWYRVPRARAGHKVEMVSIEPIILLCVTRKVMDVGDLNVAQPFYSTHWSPETTFVIPATPGIFQRFLTRWPHGRLRSIVRNIFRVVDLGFGITHYSLRGGAFETVKVPAAWSRPR